MLSNILRARILAITCGCEDADDLDYLRANPAFEIACGGGSLHVLEGGFADETVVADALDVDETN
jgi:hypothetical protein